VSSKQVWFITGASRGMGVEFAKAALAAGHKVVGTGRDGSRVSQAVGESPNLLALPLDITRNADAEATVRAAVSRFNRIDVLVNNAADFQAGYFEEMSADQFRAQIEVNLFGTLNVTRAVLAVMREQRSGHIITISSIAGLASSVDFTSAYAASKFALEGWMEALRAEVAPFGIHATVVNPGFFRTDLLSEQSTRYADPSITDYDSRRTALMAGWKSTHGQQPGDPKKLAQALVSIASQHPPPRRFLAGADSIRTAEQKIADLKADIESNRQLSISLAFDPQPLVK
jgi:NAD(P)-dependent dehydrogenase (short-subunit alcohol dehydrogenase family)